MMLEMKDRCEVCGVELAMASTDARICSFECTFCHSCANGPLNGQCPNCKGELVARPRRLVSLECPIDGHSGPTAK